MFTTIREPESGAFLVRRSKIVLVLVLDRLGLGWRRVVVLRPLGIAPYSRSFAARSTGDILSHRITSN